MKNLSAIDNDSNMIQFSIIIPVWNAEKTLAQCLDALEQQTLARNCYEIIVVDDGSTDSTAEIAQKYSVRYYFQENQGPAAARNVGVEMAEGNLVFFTDSDCVPKDNWLLEMSRPFSRSEVAAVKGTYCNKQKQIVARFAQLEFEERFSMLRRLESIDMVDTYSAAFRKEIFLSLGGFDIRFPAANNEDTELSYRMSTRGYTMVFAPMAVVCHLGHPASIKRYVQLKFSRGYWRMMVYRMFPGKMVKDSYTPQTLKLQIITLFFFLLCLVMLPLFPLLAVSTMLCLFLIFLLLTLSFTVTAFKKDFSIALFVPLFLALRAGAIGSGVIWGMICMRMGKNDYLRDNSREQEL